MTALADIRALRPVRVAILGATGYGGAELLRLLLPRPDIQVVHALAKDNLGKAIGEVHLSLGPLSDLRFADLPPEVVAPEVDVVLAGLPHKASAPLVAAYSDLGNAVIDLSGDFRLLDASAYARFYEVPHPMPERLGTFVYGLPELHRQALRTARRVASPGCFATCMTLALLPFAEAGWLQGAVQVSAMTGSSGSGALPQAGTHHPLRAQTLRPYKPLGHQHTPEVEQTLTLAGARDLQLAFVPVSAPLVRGILVTAFFAVDAAVAPEAIVQCLHDRYAQEPLVRVVAGRLPEVNAVAGSMFVEVAVTVGEVGPDGRRAVVAHACLDNLVKGGAGQAVQSLNLMIGADEFMGLLTPKAWP
jgi:N-acetyl-gamma-glutamyl-phosphate reductase common form